MPAQPEKAHKRPDAGVVDNRRSPFARIHSVPLAAVEISGGFWAPRVVKNLGAGLASSLELMEKEGYLENFRVAAGKSPGRITGQRRRDPDLSKWMEAVSFSLVTGGAPDEIQARLDEIIDLYLEAQDSDGYLVTYYRSRPPEERMNPKEILEGSHELYCAGHLIQAGIAHYRATGETRLLDAGRRFADLIVKTFGPGKRQGCSGHPELEMAMVELYRVTGDRAYLDFAEYLLEQLGLPGLDEVTGHAVRCLYKCCGAADFYMESGKPAYLESLERMWREMVGGKMYITGGVGVGGHGEGFAAPYDLPNAKAYCESCAAIANFMWNYRMLLATGECRYADVMERVLYNGLNSAASVDGTEFFYVNPLECENHRRQAWHGCYCCPPNVLRTMASLPGYFYGTDESGIWVLLYGESKLSWRLEDGTAVILTQHTDYPWEGKVEIEVSPEKPKEFAVFVRIPDWCTRRSVEAPHSSTPVRPRRPGEGEFRKLEGLWSPGDRIVVHFDMPVILWEADSRIKENRGKVAVQRGPLVYCAESVDNPRLEELRVLRPRSLFSTEFQPGLLGGLSVVRARAVLPAEVGGSFYEPAPSESTWEGFPYRPLRGRVREGKEIAAEETTITLIPYYAFANRGGATKVWLPYVSQ